MDSGQEIIQQVSGLSYFGILGLSVIANIVVPVPEEIVILALGFITGKGLMNYWIVAGIMIFGAWTTDVLMFWLSKNNNRFVTGFYNKVFSKMFPINEIFLKSHIKKVIFFSRFLVQLRFLGPFLAGQVKTPWLTFILYDLLAILIYVPGLMWLGHYFSKHIENIFAGVNSFKNGIILLVAIVTIWSLGQYMKNFLFKTFNKEKRDKKK
jgi:membrane protein DedA with SNARE-associated domain